MDLLFCIQNSAREILCFLDIKFQNGKRHTHSRFFAYAFKSAEFFGKVAQGFDVFCHKLEQSGHIHGTRDLAHFLGIGILYTLDGLVNS